MPIQRHRADFEILPEDVLAAWREIPPPIVSDCMGRTNVMAAAIKPLKPGTVLVGQARTVQCMVGDNSALHVASTLVEPGQIIVADGGGYTDTAIWGGIMTRAALQRNIGGIIVDGAIRDSAEIAELGFPCFTRAIVPAGPHKGFGGIIDGNISCAGAPVNPGDLIIGDDDGVAVVPLARQAELLEASLKKIAEEVQTNKETLEGIMPATALGLGEAEWID